MAREVSGRGLDGPGEAEPALELVLSVGRQTDALGVIRVGDTVHGVTHELDDKAVLTALPAFAWRARGGVAGLGKQEAGVVDALGHVAALLVAGVHV